eukprot:COSAG02_NODE_967_length_15586_cov_9.185704_5_plen_95_part_00
MTARIGTLLLQLLLGSRQALFQRGVLGAQREQILVALLELPAQLPAVLPHVQCGRNRRCRRGYRHRHQVVVVQHRHVGLLLSSAHAYARVAVVP